MTWFLIVISILILFHLIVILTYNFVINPYEPSIFTKIFPYMFIYNLTFSKVKLQNPYFSIRVDINTSRENVKKHNEGVLELIELANKYTIPITFSISTEYLPYITSDVIKGIKDGNHEVISHGAKHKKITSQDQIKSIKNSKKKLEDKFGQKVIGLIGPQGEHDSKTLKAARLNDIKYISSGTLSLLRYWSFPYPFKKGGIWLLGGSIKSDYQLYEKDKLKSNKALEVWKEAIGFRTKKGWYTQLEYHNSSTTKEKLNSLEDLFRYIESLEELKPVTQSELIKEVS